MNTDIFDQLTDQFFNHFHSAEGAALLKVFSPGRINLLGEHIDYNGGSVLPAAVDLGIYAIGRPNGSKRIRLFSMAFQENYEASAIDIRKGRCGWANYILGVTKQFEGRGVDIPGFDFIFDGDLPIGSGLSSSAALENATGVFLNELTRSRFAKEEIAVMGQKAEHEYADVQCGIMDQMASIMGKSGHLIHLNTETLDHEYIPLQLKDHELLLIDSKVKHSHASSGYNTRRAEREQLLKVLRSGKDFENFHQIDLDFLDANREGLDSELYLRGKFVIEEIDRVNEAVAMLKENRLDQVGRLMYEAHEGLSKLYKVSCEEIDFLIDQCKLHREILGARMMGGGFGGCALLLMEKGAAQVPVRIMAAYEKQYNIQSVLIKVAIDEGARLVSL